MHTHVRKLNFAPFKNSIAVKVKQKCKQKTCRKGNENICWTKPKGGYFLSLYLKRGFAKKVATKCRELGVILTDVGAAFPYGIDKDDTHIRFAPTYASIEAIKLATEVLCEVIKNEVV